MMISLVTGLIPATLAFTPLYDPLPALYPGMSDHWLWMALPLVVAISVVYKTTRVEHLWELPREAAVMSAQMLVIMAFAAVILACGYWSYLRIG